MKKPLLATILFLLLLTGCAVSQIDSEPSSPDTPTQTEILDILKALEYQPYTCDGLPEYLLYTDDGTLYSFNLSENGSVAERTSKPNYRMN